MLQEYFFSIKNNIKLLMNGFVILLFNNVQSCIYQKGSNIRKELKLLVKFYKKLLRKFLKIII